MPRDRFATYLGIAGSGRYKQKQMRKIPFLALILAVLAFAACTKDEQPLRVNPKNLEGIWELRMIGGGMLPFNPEIVRAGNGDQWRFTETEFGKYFKDSLYRTGRYTISRGTGTDPNTQRAIDQFVFDQVPSESFELRDDTLRFYYGPIAADGIIMMYAKISDQY
jgi:hypothetical protein